MDKMTDIPIRPCLRSGLCCKKGPCPFGAWDAIAKQCTYLEEHEAGPGWQTYRCGRYTFIQALPPEAMAEFAPAFGAGCCMPLFNRDRDAILHAQRGSTTDA